MEYEIHWNIRHLTVTGLDQFCPACACGACSVIAEEVVRVATGRITKRAVDALSPGDKDQFLWDTEVSGFGLKVTPKGARTYVVQYRMGGRETPAQRRTIGKHGVWTPDTGREEARRVLRLVDQGTDPRELDRKRRKEAVHLAFDSYAALFTELYLKKEWKGWHDAQRQLELHCIPHLKKRPITELRRSDMTVIFDSIANRAALSKSVFALLRKMFNWAEHRGDLEKSPLYGMKAPPGVKARSRTLTDEEIIAIWLAANEMGDLFGPILKLLLLNGQRLEENTAMEWREVSTGKQMWTLPERRTKNGLVHLVPLTLTAVEIIQAQKLTSPEFVFSSDGKNAPNGWSRARRRLDKKMLEVLRARAEERGEDPSLVQLNPFVLHDLRRTVATGLPSLGVSADHVEAVLNHISGVKAGVAGVYNHYNYLPEKAAALTKWDAHLRALVAAPNQGSPA